MRTQIPKFRLPEFGDRRGDRLHPQSRRRVQGRSPHREHEGAARGEVRRDLRRLRRAARPRARHSRPEGSCRQRPYRHRLAVLGVVRPHRQDRQARDRARRRQHRDGLLPHRAPPRRRGRQGGRALRLRGDEGLALGEGRRDPRGHPDPQLHGAGRLRPRQRQAHRRHLPEGEGRIRRQGPAQSGAVGRARPDHSPATTCWSRSARRTPSPGSSAIAASSSTNGTCPRSIRRRLRSTNPKVFFGGDAAFGPKNIIWAVAHGHDAALSIHKMLSGEDITERPLPEVHVSSQKMGIHEWSYDNDISQRQALQGAASRQGDRAEGHPHRGRARLRRQARARRGASLPELRRADRVLDLALHRVRCLRRHLPDGLHHLHGERRGSRSARSG